MRFKRLTLFLLLALAGCESEPIEVSHPFYLWHLEDPSNTYLFRCIEPADECAVDGLPGPGVISAGADSRYVVVKTDHGYFYFKRTAHETKGWGNDPEKIIGPLNEHDFKATAEKLRLPNLSVHP
ncbi:hypothetical protein ACQKO5_05145 [Novosphingobium subterraneum]|uniref:hypothetical protein n=1 Tax=Novosphingobium subterraneum TaxID=48936 RepID=UPI003D01C9B2